MRIVRQCRSARASIHVRGAQACCLIVEEHRTKIETEARPSGRLFERAVKMRTTEQQIFRRTAGKTQCRSGIKVAGYTGIAGTSPGVRVLPANFEAPPILDPGVVIEDLGVVWNGRAEFLRIKHEGFVRQEIIERNPPGDGRHRMRIPGITMSVIDRSGGRVVMAAMQDGAQPQWIECNSCRIKSKRVEHVAHQSMPTQLHEQRVSDAPDPTKQVGRVKARGDIANFVAAQFPAQQLLRRLGDGA